MKDSSRALREAGHDPDGADVLLLGAGGAARAVADALGRSGARVTVAARRPDAAAAAAALAAGSVLPWEARAVAAGRASMIVNATPIGLGGGEELPVPPDLLEPGHVVVDLVYSPLVTPLLRAAAEHGASVVDGLGMLVHQAALQIEMWTGRDAPVDVMRTAAGAALAAR